jgi:hypothetical protein
MSFSVRKLNSWTRETNHMIRQNMCFWIVRSLLRQTMFIRQKHWFESNRVDP